MEAELVKLWAEARGNADYYYEKYRSTAYNFLGGKSADYYAEHLRWAKKANIFKGELDKLRTPNKEIIDEINRP